MLSISLRRNLRHFAVVTLMAGWMQPTSLYRVRPGSETGL